LPLSSKIIKQKKLMTTIMIIKTLELLRNMQKIQIILERSLTLKFNNKTQLKTIIIIPPLIVLMKKT